MIMMVMITMIPDFISSEFKVKFSHAFLRFPSANNIFFLFVFRGPNIQVHVLMNVGTLIVEQKKPFLYEDMKRRNLDFKCYNLPMVYTFLKFFNKCNRSYMNTFFNERIERNTLKKSINVKTNQMYQLRSICDKHLYCCWNTNPVFMCLCNVTGQWKDLWVIT